MDERANDGGPDEGSGTADTPPPIGTGKPRSPLPWSTYTQVQRGTFVVACTGLILGVVSIVALAIAASDQATTCRYLGPIEMCTKFDWLWIPTFTFFVVGGIAGRIHIKLNPAEFPPQSRLSALREILRADLGGNKDPDSTDSVDGGPATDIARDRDQQ
ncbi:MAG: hypothetical protein ABFR53_08255 [Actinomycetota bacterium]